MPNTVACSDAHTERSPKAQTPAPLGRPNSQQSQHSPKGWKRLSLKQREPWGDQPGFHCPSAALQNSKEEQSSFQGKGLLGETPEEASAAR